MKLLKYAIRDEKGETISVFDAASLLEAVGNKRVLEDFFSARDGRDRIYTVREARPSEIRNFKPHALVIAPGTEGTA